MDEKIINDYRENKEEWLKMMAESRAEKLKKLEGLHGHAYYAKIHEMRANGEW